MKALGLGLFAAGAALVATAAPAAAPEASMKVVLVIHGGAGVGPRGKLSAEREAQCRADLEAAL